MTHKVYIHAPQGFPVDDWALWAYMGWRNSGIDIVFFDDIEEVPASKWHIIVAGIEQTNSYLKRLGLPEKQALNIPKCIEKYADRQIWRTNMASVREQIDEDYIKFPVFIKPNGRAKEFIAGILENEGMFQRHMSSIPDETEVLLSEVVDFVSEYRGYICQGELLGILHYKGDIRVFPDMKVVDEAIDVYTNNGAPAGYSMDFGITSDGRTLLVECNDGWSLGNYGLEPSKYCRLLGRRWYEMMKGF